MSPNDTPPRGERPAWLDRATVIVGATASGKSALAMVVAQRQPESTIVAVDSMQVYRGMDIGTAKPTVHDQRAVRHVGIDLVDPTDRFTVVEFVAAADAALADTTGSIVVVAGTGLYLRSLLDRLEPPGAWPELRAELEAETDLVTMYRRLTALDPAAAAKIEPGNQRRMVRALEVCLGSGRPFSSFGPGLEVIRHLRCLRLACGGHAKRSRDGLTPGSTP